MTTVDNGCDENEDVTGTEATTTMVAKREGMQYMGTMEDLMPSRTIKPKLISDAVADSILDQCDQELFHSNLDQIMEEARQVAANANLSVESDLPALVTPHPSNDGGIQASTMTGGHSNTNHVVLYTKDFMTDRIAELRRNLLTRVRIEQPERLGTDRWDKPRIQGERRRRIIREKDLPGAPSEPPLSGYIIFVGQMTIKMRHDHPDKRHSQTAVVQEISKAWRIALSDQDRMYYEDFAAECRKEYRQLMLEYRATGFYTPSPHFERIDGTGLWLRKSYDKKNALEREIATYDTVKFPPRPAQFDEEYNRREAESKRKRKLKLKPHLNEDGTEKAVSPGVGRRKLIPPSNSSLPSGDDNHSNDSSKQLINNARISCSTQYDDVIEQEHHSNKEDSDAMVDESITDNGPSRQQAEEIKQAGFDGMESSPAASMSQSDSF